MYSTYMFMNSEAMVYSLREKKSSLYVSLLDFHLCSRCFFSPSFLSSLSLSPLCPLLTYTVCGSTQLEWDWWLDCWDGFSTFCPTSLYQLDMPPLACTYVHTCTCIYLYVHVYTLCMCTYSVNVCLYSRAVACINRASFRHCC